MTLRARTTRMHLLTSAAFLAVLALPTAAKAEEERRVRTFDDSTVYHVELEPHFAFGAENVYGAAGFGAGLRASIPLADGYVGRLPDNFAISFGGDFLHYENCYYGSNCGAQYLLIPVAAQWNVFVARRVSLFAEGGVFVYKGWVTNCAASDGPGCTEPSTFGALPTLAVGGRIHLGDNAAFTMRVGYPTITLGVSFL